MADNRDPAIVAITKALAEPFDQKDVKFKPQMVKNNRCLAMAYIDARLIQDRLDEVLGPENWEDNYKLLPDGSAMCRLRIRLGGKWVTKHDVGSPSEQPDSGDRLKAAVSDALKRTAVKFGVGRYLYRIGSSWVDYDPVKKQIVSPPQLPSWAVPSKQVSRSKPATVANDKEIEEAAKNKELTDAEVEKRLHDQKEWLTFISSEPDIGDMNNALRKFSKIDPAIKQNLWDKTLDYTQRKSWDYDPREKKFTARHKENSSA